MQQINTITGQIAGLNTQISTLTGIGQNASAFVNQRDVLIGQLSNLIGVSQISTENNGLTIVTAEMAHHFVTGGQSFQLTSHANSSGHQDVFAGGTDITSQITSGALAGYIQVRDPND